MRSQAVTEHASLAFITLFVLCIAATGVWTLVVAVPAIGATTPVAPLCGPNWSVISSPNADTEHNELPAVAAISANDVWAVGDYSNGDIHQTLVEHWDGNSWSVVNSPNAGTGGNNFIGVAAISANDMWAVGYYDNGTSYQTLVEHWDGTAWAIVHSPSVGTHSSFLSRVAAISANDVWAVGFYDNGPAFLTLVEHWDGNSWSVANSPNTGTHDNYLYGVAAISANDVWAVGYYDNGNGTTSQTLVEHWDGNSWSVANSPNVGTHDNNLVGVAAISANDVWAVGDYSNGDIHQTLVEHWDGNSWSVVNSPNAGTGGNNLAGVAATSANDMWAVGYYENGTSYQTLVEHWDGNSWGIVYSPNGSTHGNNLVGVAATSANGVWAVGYYSNGTADLTLVERYNPCVPTATPTSTPTSASTSTSTSTPTPTSPLPPPATQSVPPAPAQTPASAPTYPPADIPGLDSRFFPQTGKTVRGIFLDYWNTHGGLAQQGYPISDMFGEVSDLNGQVYTVQYFERAVFEYHPENAPPNDVLLSLLGYYTYKQKYPGPEGAPYQNNSPPAGAMLFPETGKWIAGGFLDYWKSHGGLAQQGYPISNEFEEKSATDGKVYSVQYFQRAVFEYHPEYKGTPNEVLLSLLGAFRYNDLYPGK